MAYYGRLPNLVDSMRQQPEDSHPGLGSDVHLAAHDHGCNELVSISKTVPPIANLAAVVQLMGQVRPVLGVQDPRAGQTRFQCPYNTVLRPIGRDSRCRPRVRKLCCRLPRRSRRQIRIRHRKRLQSIAPRPIIENAVKVGRRGIDQALTVRL
jgi:hypothetical protein